MTDPKLRVKMSGYEYIEYLKYKEESHKPLPEGFIKFWKHTWIYFACASVLGLTATYLHETPEVVVTYINILGYSVPSILPVLIICSICLAWIIHGFGFIIIKR